MPVKDAQDGYSFVYPFGWQEVSVEGQDVVYKDVIEPLESVSVSLVPTEKKEVSEFGEAREVAFTLADKVLTAPNQEVSILNVGEVGGCWWWWLAGAGWCWRVLAGWWVGAGCWADACWWVLALGQAGGLGAMEPIGCVWRNGRWGRGWCRSLPARTAAWRCRLPPAPPPPCSPCRIDARSSSPACCLPACLQRTDKGRVYYDFEFTAKSRGYTRHALASVTVGNGEGRGAPHAARPACWPAWSKGLLAGWGKLVWPAAWVQDAGAARAPSTSLLCCMLTSLMAAAAAAAAIAIYLRPRRQVLHAADGVE